MHHLHQLSHTDLPIMIPILTTLHTMVATEAPTMLIDTTDQDITVLTTTHTPLTVPITSDHSLPVFWNSVVVFRVFEVGHSSLKISLSFILKNKCDNTVEARAIYNKQASSFIKRLQVLKIPLHPFSELKDFISQTQTSFHFSHLQLFHKLKL